MKNNSAYNTLNADETAIFYQRRGLRNLYDTCCEKANQNQMTDFFGTDR